MGQFVSLSGPALDLMLYGEKGQGAGNYILNQINSIAPGYNEFSQRLVNSVQSSYNFLSNQMTQYGIRNELQRQGLQTVDNNFNSLYSFTDIQNASLTMQRWVMSHPEIKKLFVEQNIDGYSDTYQNHWGKGIAEEDYNYRRVMNGVVQPTDDGYKIQWFEEDLIPGDKELDEFERHQVLNTWSTIDWLLENTKFDFTRVSDTPSKINK